MFGLFKKKSELEKLSDAYAKAMSEAQRLSTTNHKAGDEMYAKAEEINKKIEAIQNAQ